jgi:hypothetical protein
VTLITAAGSLVFSKVPMVLDDLFALNMESELSVSIPELKVFKDV